MVVSGWYILLGWPTILQTVELGLLAVYWCTKLARCKPNDLKPETLAFYYLYFRSRGEGLQNSDAQIK